MKISYNWLKQYLNIDLPAEEVSEILTSIGLEVEDIIPFETIKGGLKGVVTGKVLQCSKHPNADKLSLTQVDIGGNEPLSIVCGAPNVAAGQKVLVATIGTTIHLGEKSFEIKKSKIRGETSEGMICAEDELGLGDSHDGIMVLDEATPIGITAAKLFNVEQDHVFEIGLTPNRSDATSHIGVARDLAAAINHRAGKTVCALEYPSIDNFSIDNESLSIPVIIEDSAACPRYSGLSMTGIKVGPSPDWLKNKLLSVGVRPINNVVDITNYVLFETGQPLHAFDAAYVSGNKVIIKKLAEGTPFVTLDEVERKLSANDLMICNTVEAMCIGGVFGGDKSGVTENTTSIFLESACFDAKTIRKTSKYHGLQTDASFRFERGSDPEITVYALKRAAMLIKETAGGQISSQLMDEYPNPVKPTCVRLDFEYLNKLIGQEIPAKEVIQILGDLKIKIKQLDEKGLDLSVPAFKTDVNRPADIVEEVLRIYGYNKVAIPEKLKISINQRPTIDTEALQNTISDMLSANGFYELMNNSLSSSAYAKKFDFVESAHDVVILNPLSSELDVMRQTLLFGGLESVAYNQNRKNPDLKLYEFGTVYSYDQAKKAGLHALDPYHEEKHLDLFMTGSRNHESWNKSDDSVDFYDLKQALESIFKRLDIPVDSFETDEIEHEAFEYALGYAVGGRQLARAGKLSPALRKHFDIKKEVFYANICWSAVLDLNLRKGIRYETVPKYPAVRRDLALVLDKHIAFKDLKAAAFGLVPDLLASVNIFDVYAGDKIPADKKSYAISFILLDKEKTLTDKVIEKTMDKLLRHYQSNFGATLR